MKRGGGVHESSFVVRSTQVDTFGHLNSCAYLELYEWARWEWWAANGIDLVAFREGKRRGPVILRADVSFVRELRLGEAIVIRTRLQEATRVKASFAQEMTTAAGTTASTARITFVLIDIDSRRPVPMSRRIMALMSSEPEAGVP